MRMMPVLLDVDGVLADFAGHLLGTIGSRLTAADVTAWDIFALLDAEGLRGAALDTLKSPAWWASQPLIPGARDLVRGLVEAELDVVLVTSPWLSCVGWETARREWARGLWRSVGAETGPGVIVTDRKDLVAGAVFVDDKPEHVAAWDAAWGSSLAWLFDAPYNRGAKLRASVDRLHGWTPHSIATVLRAGALCREARG
jgi:5'(3')-deoxyribonucleotidase